MAMTLITTNTSSNAANSSFTSGIDSTYKLYIFKWYNVNPVTDAQTLTFQGNVALTGRTVSKEFTGYGDLFDRTLVFGFDFKAAFPSVDQEFLM